MYIRNISKKNSVFSKLGFGWVQTMAVLVVMGMVLSCGSDDATAPPVIDLNQIGLKHTEVTSTKVALEWDEMEEADFYRVFYTNITAGGPEVSNQVDINKFATSATLTPDTEYRFEVQTCNNSKCSARVSISVTTLEAITPPTITYPNMASEVSATSMPEIFNSDDCDLRSFTNAGTATFSIDRITIGSGPYTVYAPDIDSTTGVIKNRLGFVGFIQEANPGSYRVTVEVTGNPECKTDVIVYNTITPDDLDALKGHLFGSGSGVDLHGDAGDYNYIDTSKVMSFYELFTHQTTFNGDISRWDTSKVANMQNMFNDADSFNQSIGGWDTSKVTNMQNMFYDVDSFNQPIGGWDTTQVESMSFMFFGASKFNYPLSNWNTSKVINMSYMFNTASEFNQPIGGWDTTQVENMRAMFLGASKFNQPLSNWNTSKVEDMSEMFNLAESFNQPLSNWNTVQVQNMRDMFRDAKSFDQPIGGWNTENVRNMSLMFYYATKFNRPLSNWNTSKVENMISMFSGASEFNQPIGNWETSNVTLMRQMFDSATKFNKPLSNWNTSQVTDMGGMFFRATMFDQDLSKWDVDKVDPSKHSDVFTESAMENLTDKHPKWKP